MLDIFQFGKELTPPLGNLSPHRVLYDFEGPRIFTVESDFGLLLVYVLKTERDSQFAILSPTSDELVQRLMEGHSTVREALQSTWAWLVSTDYDWKLQRAVSLKAPIPEELLPRPGVMLYRHLQPILSVRLEGKKLHGANVRASAIRQAIDAATVSVKRVLDHLWDVSPEGRPTNALRFLSDLPAQRFVFGSFEVAFGRPAEEPKLIDTNALESDLARVGEELESLMLWAEEADVQRDEPDLALLKALERLVPPSTGPVEKVIVSGAMFKSGRRHQMTRTATKKVRTALREQEKGQMLLSLAGRIGELDKDKLQFTLRDITDITGAFSRKECLCRFSNELFDAIFEYFGSDSQVRVTGRLVRNEVEITDIAAPENETSGS